jgi:hypothetical protein
MGLWFTKDKPWRSYSESSLVEKKKRTAAVSFFATKCCCTRLVLRSSFLLFLEIPSLIEAFSFYCLENCWTWSWVGCIIVLRVVTCELKKSNPFFEERKKPLTEKKVWDSPALNFVLYIRATTFFSASLFKHWTRFFFFFFEKHLSLHISSVKSKQTSRSLDSFLVSCSSCPWKEFFSVTHDAFH